MPKSWIVIGILFVILIISIKLIIVSHTEYIDITVTGKESINKGDDHIYLVYTNKTTYCVRDSWYYWRWNSSDVYGKIKANTRYYILVAGYRIPFFSAYQNIIEIQEIVN